MDQLIKGGCRCFKFVDRTFNLLLADSLRILDFFLERIKSGDCADVFLHFEMVPDRLPQEIRDRMRCFPAGVVQFEIGIQTFNKEVCQTIERRMNVQATEDNIRFLVGETGVHIHADLIAGLPGETLASFADSFDRLWYLEPHDIQLGILKRLKGTTIATEDMVFSENPPFEIVQNKDLSFRDLQRLKRLARVIDIFVNPKRFAKTIRLVLESDANHSPFHALMAFSDWIWRTYHIEHGIALKRQFDFLLAYLTQGLGLEPGLVIEVIRQDFESLGSRKGMPDFLRPQDKHVASRGSTKGR